MFPLEEGFGEPWFPGLKMRPPPQAAPLLFKAFLESGMVSVFRHGTAGLLTLAAKGL